MSFYSPPKFFKIIQNRELQSGELRVPKKFVETFWKGIPNPIVIIFPNGVQQKIFWVKRDGDIWLQKNWEKIAKFLKFGYLVYFKYMGGSCFQLEILGLNSLEIDYSKVKLTEVESVNNVAEEVKKEDGHGDETNIGGTSQRTKIGNTLSKRTKIGNNPSFDLTLTSTYATGYLFRIPCDFSRKYLKDFEGFASIRVGDDKIWKICVKYDPKRDYSFVNSGWKPFAIKYNLQTDDVCKFEMTRFEPLSFSITINRAENN